MRTLSPSTFLPYRLFALSIACISLVGCSGIGTAAFPDASANAVQVPVGNLQGSVYGGHAPLVGAHVYLLTPSQAGYGKQASSLLSATYQANGGGTTYATHLNTSDPNIPTTWYYELTDSTGAYNISGDYPCTAGNPVYLYAYGGSPTFPSGSNAFASTTFTVQSVAGSTYTLLFTVSTTENFYEGEPITLSGYTNGGTTATDFAFLNGQTANVLTAGISTTQFELTVSDTDTTFTNTGLTTGHGAYAATGTATATPGFNPGVVNLAVLGVCPSTGSLAGGGTLFNGNTSNPIQYIYMNEVSTAAAAYALEGFAPAAPTATTNATYVSTTANNLIGLQNAFLSAAQLYDINGAYITSTYAGEGHIANPKTPGGNGSVPQNLLDTMGNILAACVDSNNTSTVDGNAAESAQCKTLFETATSNGIPKGKTGAGNIPVDTAQAMLNIAHHPAGDPSNTTTFMTNLYTLPTGNVPFTPDLASSGAGQPNDFTVAIQYPLNFATNTKITSATGLSANPAANGPESIAIDGFGNAWVNDLAAPYEILELDPLGVLTYTSAASAYKLGYVTIDPNNNVFSGSNYSQGDETEIVASGTANLATTRTTYTYTGNYGGTTAPFNADGFYNGYMSVANGAGDIFIGATSPATNNGNATTAQEYTIALNPSTPGTFASLFTPASMNTIVGSIGAHGAVENASAGGDIWWSNEQYVGTNNNAFAILRVNATTGKPETGFPIQYTANNAINRPEMPAIDKNGNLWVPGRLSNTLLEVTSGAVVTTNHTGNALNNPFGLSIDGDNEILIGADVNATGTSIAKFSIANNTNISPATNNYTLGGQLKVPLNIAMDQSGNLWITTNTNNTIVEWIGAGAPTYNPLSKASKNNALSTRP